MTVAPKATTVRVWSGRTLELTVCDWPAWAEASRHFVDLPELQDRSGERIAKLVGAEAALVTTGAAGALLLGTAAAVTRGDRKLIPRLPDTTGMRNEVILQKSHHSCYDNQLTAVGAKLIDVETAADVEKAVGGRTARPGGG